MAAQEDPTPWELPPELASEDGPEKTSQDAAALIGRAHFSILGAVRRKPARMDAESTRSKSCSDKLAMRQVSSLLSRETSLLVAPTENAYLEGIVLPEEEISRVACERAFGTMGRMRDLNERTWSWPLRLSSSDHDPKYAYSFRPFQIHAIPAGQIERIWPFRKPSPSPPGSTAKKPKPANASVIWTIAPSHHIPTPDHNPKSLPKLRGSNTGLYETVINGVKQGNRVTTPSARGASALSRARLWALVQDVILLAQDKDKEKGQDHSSHWQEVLEASTYSEFKIGASGVREQAIQDVKKVLKGWTPNTGDDEWGLDVLIDPKKQKRKHIT